mmetsp:Transcript_17561/g.27480  ORF Transcript_17561/g.27480 Transcript_17561/m.27480 type:complete len:112 (+) Transcript_17561:1462-1797(+)
MSSSSEHPSSPSSPGDPPPCFSPPATAGSIWIPLSDEGIVGICSVDSLPEKAPIDLSFVHPFFFQFAPESYEGGEAGGEAGRKGTAYFGVEEEVERKKWMESLELICRSLD